MRHVTIVFDEKLLASLTRSFKILFLFVIGIWYCEIDAVNADWTVGNWVKVGLYYLGFSQDISNLFFNQYTFFKRFDERWTQCSRYIPAVHLQINISQSFNLTLFPNQGMVFWMSRSNTRKTLFKSLKTANTLHGGLKIMTLRPHK